MIGLDRRVSEPYLFVPVHGQGPICECEAQPNAQPPGQEDFSSPRPCPFRGGPHYARRSCRGVPYCDWDDGEKGRLLQVSKVEMPRRAPVYSENSGASSPVLGRSFCGILCSHHSSTVTPLLQWAHAAQCQPPWGIRQLGEQGHRSDGRGQGEQALGRGLSASLA